MKATDLHRAKGFVIHDKVDLEAYDAVDEKEARKTLNLDSEHIYGLYVGGYSKLKGFHILMDAIADIQDPRLRIIVIGCSREDIEKNGTKHAHLIFKAYDRCRNFEHVLFYPISNQIQLFFKACDFVIVPSTLAHQARPIYEAGAAGKPLIISDYPNLYEFLTEYGMNYMFPPNDSAMLGLKINELTADLNSGKVKEMLIKARYLTEKKHSLKTLQDEMDKLFYEI
jgi:glycosyltransferase involved in cell wall biosynthesis